MEDALQRLMKESGSTKYASVATAAHKALGEYAVRFAFRVATRATFAINPHKFP